MTVPGPSRSESGGRGYGRVEEYQAILQDTAGISGRRQNTDDLFVGLNVVFLTGLGFLLSTMHFTHWFPTVALMLISLFTFFLNRIWMRTLKDYSTLLGVRHKYIEALERGFREERGGDPNTGMFLIIGDTLYHPTDPKAPRSAQKPGRLLGFTTLELRMAWLLTGTYPAITVAVGIVTFLVTQGVIPPPSL